MATVLTLARTICRQRGEGKEEGGGRLGLEPCVRQFEGALGGFCL